MAIAEAEKLNLSGNYLFFILLGELYKDINPEKSNENLQRAYSLAKTGNDKNTILEKLKEIEGTQ